MPLPVGMQTVTITDNRAHPDGGPMRGRVIFRPRVPTVTSALYGTIVMGDAIGTWVDGVLKAADGSTGVKLLASDAADCVPTGWTYEVIERPYNAAGRSYDILLANALGPTVKLSTLAPTSPANGDYVTVPGPIGPAGPAGPTGPTGPQGPTGANGSNADAEAYTDAAIADEVTRANGAYETPAGATAKVTAHSAATDPHGDRAAAAGSLAAHEADTTAVHGIADTAALETTSGATAKVTAHKDALDPHGDRAWADTKFATQAAVSSLDGFVNDALTRVSAIEGGTAWLSGLQVAGNAIVSGGDLTVSDFAKGYRFRRGGSALDFEATGADMILSNWSGTGFNGTQYSYLRLSADAQNMQVAGKVESVDALYGAAKHTLDPATGVASLGAKNSLAGIRLCGRRASTGSPTTGAWTAGDAVQDSAGAWWLCTADGTPGTWTSPPATPTAHASTHGSGGTDPVTVAQSQVTGLATALAGLLPLTGGNMTGTVTNSVASAVTTAFGGGVSGDTFDRWRILASGTFEAGSGSAARDVNFRRSAADQWTTDDALIVSLMFRHLGTTLGFYGATAVTKPSVTGSKGGNAALGSLISALATLGLITDSTTA